jgi:hypothetical protein
MIAFRVPFARGGQAHGTRWGTPLWEFYLRVRHRWRHDMPNSNSLGISCLIIIKPVSVATYDDACGTIFQHVRVCRAGDTSTDLIAFVRARTPSKPPEPGYATGLGFGQLSGYDGIEQRSACAPAGALDPSGEKKGSPGCPGEDKGGQVRFWAADPSGRLRDRLTTVRHWPIVVSNSYQEACL